MICVLSAAVRQRQGRVVGVPSSNWRWRRSGEILMSTKLQIDLEREAYGSAEVCAVLGVSRTTLWEMRKSGVLPSRRLGSKILILREDLKKFLRSLPLDSDQSK
jgi:excisionase family DNA binding protein